MLTSKQRADLRAQCNTLDTTLMVGKEGITEGLIESARQQLTARELIKGRVLESALLTSIGGVLGVVAGIILAQVIARMSETPVAISIPAIILGVVFSMVIGIVFGLLPSVKAANLNPIDALRRE